MTSPRSDGCDRTRRRTRRKVTQSRNGCFTCKARRVKCDESRPTCRQCSRLHKVCDGYATERSMMRTDAIAQPISGHIGDQVLWTLQCRYSSCVLCGGCSAVSEQNRFSLLGCEILAHNAYININSLNRSVWQQLLPQMCYGQPLVRAAVAAFGATYACRFLGSDTHVITRSAVSQYTCAIRSLRLETNLMSEGPLPLLLACIVLGATELLQRRQHNALTHLQGAFRILSLHASTSTLHHPGDAASDTVPVLQSSKTWVSQGEELIILLQCLDVQLATYRFTCPPHLHYARDVCLGNPVNMVHTLEGAYLRLIPILNTYYHFIAKVRLYKYHKLGSFPHGLSIEQGRHIAALHVWLCNLDNRILKEQLVTSVRGGSLARILRVQCVSALINLSTAVVPQETAYDVHGLQFQYVIGHAAQVLEQTVTSTPNPTHVSLGLGIAEALFLAACKYRHSVFRRQATDLLGKLGREGPWEGRLLAAVAMRVIEIEEQQLGEKQSTVPQAVAEHCRVHGCVMAESPFDNSVTVDFSRNRHGGNLTDTNARMTDVQYDWEEWSETLTYSNL